MKELRLILVVAVVSALVGAGTALSLRAPVAEAQGAPTWQQECIVVPARAGFNNPPNDQLARRGQQGWELVSSSMGANDSGWRAMFCFKRRAR